MNKKIPLKRAVPAKKNKKPVTKLPEKQKPIKKPVKRKLPSRQPLADKKGLETLNLAQLKMFEARVHDGCKYVDAYAIGWPKSKMSRLNQAKQAYAEWNMILEKIGGERELFKLAGIGPDILPKILLDAATAEKIIIRGERAVTVPDHRVRIAAAKEIKDIHGLGKSVIELEGTITTKQDINFDEILKKAQDKK